jgi:hypothetical protein
MDKVIQVTLRKLFQGQTISILFSYDCLFSVRLREKRRASLKNCYSISLLLRPEIPSDRSDRERGEPWDGGQVFCDVIPGINLHQAK